MELNVSKYHGCGNDFILLDAEQIQGWGDEKKRDFIRSVCDRHTGIGADGCIFVSLNPLEMIYYNQDGSRADMCGNGIRCFAAYCHDNGLVEGGMYDVTTLSGVRTITEISNHPFTVMVDMGSPVWENEKIGVSLSEPIWRYPLEIDGQIYELYSFYLGTIHTILFVEDAFDPALSELGEKIGKHPMFSAQTNVNFVQLVDENHLRASTWERGCGMTLACGTGMCSSALCTSLLGKTGKHVEIEMKKGSLHVDISGKQQVFLTGPAIRIMKGIYYYDEKETA